MFQDEKKNKKNYYAIEVTTTQACNMRCTYCFEGDELQLPKHATKAIDQKVIIKSINSILKSKDLSKIYNGVTINFWGGEPTLNYKYCQDLIKAFSDAPVDFFFYTNGLNNENILKIINYFNMLRLDHSRISFQISYDGLWNDESRLTINESGTSEIVLHNFEKLINLFPDIRITLKSTLPVEKLCNDDFSVVNNWKHFNDLYLKLGDRVQYSPTLEYTKSYELDSNHIFNAEIQFLKIAKLELEFFMKNKRHLMGWFTVKDRQTCSAGINIGNIDLEGNLSVCHGALYSENKEDLVHGHVKDVDFDEQIIAMRNLHNAVLSLSHKHNSICDGCEATVCYQCPTVNFDNSKNETYQDKYHDPKIDLCSVYKVFGPISKTVYKYLNETMKQ